jgi:hypothetical protein
MLEPMNLPPLIARRGEWSPRHDLHEGGVLDDRQIVEDQLVTAHAEVAQRGPTDVDAAAKGAELAQLLLRQEVPRGRPSPLRAKTLNGRLRPGSVSLRPAARAGDPVPPKRWSRRDLWSAIVTDLDPSRHSWRGLGRGP